MLNQIEKDNIIDLLCTSTQENIELAITLCEGYNVNIEDIIEEYGYWSINIKGVEDFQENKRIHYSLLLDLKLPENIYNLTIHTYNNEYIKYPNKLTYLTYNYSRVTRVAESEVYALTFYNSTIDLESKIYNSVNVLTFNNCKINNIEKLIKCFPNLTHLRINDCNIKVLPDISKLINLQWFSCINCNILNIDKEYELPNSLVRLSLSKNKLTSFEINLNQVKYLDLDNNQLQILNIDLDNSELERLDATKNPDIGEIRTTRKMTIESDFVNNFYND